MALIHATAIFLENAGLLLRGPSGSGKSDLALRLIDSGAKLIADDQVALSAEGETLWASPPPALRGLLEVRGLGLICLPNITAAPVALAVDLVPPEQVPRLPEPEHCVLEGLNIALIKLCPFEVSAPAKIRAAMKALAQGSLRVGAFRP